MFSMEIKTGNAAFSNRNEEVIRILKECILKIEQGNDQGILLDLNGNLVGNYRITNR